DARAVALDDLDVDLDGVAGAEVGDVVALRSVGQLVDDVGHGMLLASATGQPRNRVESKGQPRVPAASRSPSGRSWMLTLRVFLGAVVSADWTKEQSCHSGRSAGKSGPPPG